MLTGLHIVFLGGDARHLEIIRSFTDLDANVAVIGYEDLHEQLHEVQHSKLTREVLRNADVLILPVVGTDDHGRVESSFSSETLLLNKEYMSCLPKHAKVCTGIAKSYLRNLCAELEIDLIELFSRDDVAIYNSIPTAEGALMMAIQQTEITIHGSRCMVLGLGRIGLTLASMLQRLGAHVKAGVQKPEQFARAWEMGIEPFYTKDLYDEGVNVDIIFNTVPEQSLLLVC